FDPFAEQARCRRIRTSDAHLRGNHATGRCLCPRGVYQESGLRQTSSRRSRGGSQGARKGRSLMQTMNPQGARSSRPELHHDYLRCERSIRSWLLTTDHKRIGILYLISITLFFMIGGLAATLMRLELATPKGDLVISDEYNRLFTLHGVIMVWFFLIPSIPVTLGNFLVPLMIGARDLAFPRLN